MKFLFLFIAIVIMILVKLLLTYISSNMDDKIENAKVISYSKYEKRFAIVFTFVLVLTVVLISVVLEDKYDALMISSLVFGPLILVSLVLTLFATNWSVTVDEGIVVYKSFFGVSKKYRITDFEIKYKLSHYALYIENKKIFKIAHRTNNSLLLSDELAKINARVRA